MSSWKGLNRPPIVAQRGHFRRAPCSAIKTSTQAGQMPHTHSVQANDSFRNETDWHAAQYIWVFWEE